jgi:Clustered mitochondria
VAPEGVSFPLLSLVDYLGYRVIAMSVLPIGKKKDGSSSLVYGCSDGGKVPYHVNTEPGPTAIMKETCDHLNLASHKVGSYSMLCLSGILLREAVWC